jgi:TolB-like protein/Flp pilus assembly protein TadD
MKRCPTCARVYADDALKFCRQDGSPLVQSGARAEDATRLFGDSAGLASPGSGPAAPPFDGRAVTSSSLTAPLARRRPTRRAVDSLAVLPFTNEGGDSNADYLCDGITESIINTLSQLPRLRVLPRSTVFRYRGAEVDPQLAGQQLGVRAVLTGRVVEVGESLVIKTELIDVAQESHLWGEQYRRELTDIFALQEEISRDISQKLRLKLTGEDRRRLSKRYTENTDAYRAYLQGRYFVGSKRTEDWIKKGIDCFQRAIDLDPSYALAYSGLADAYAFLASSTGERPPREAYPKAKAAAERALELDPELAEAHTSLGFSLLLYDWDFQRAAREFKRALKLNPSYGNAHDGLGFYYKATAQFGRAVKECEESRRLDPLSPFPEVSLGWAYYFDRQFERATECGRKALELDARSAFAGWIVGVACGLAGRADEAVAALSRAVEHSGGGLTFRAHLGWACALAGRDEEARRLLAELAELSRQKYVPAYYRAIIRLGLRERDETFAELERALEERSGFLVFLHVEPMFDTVRDDPRFAELSRRVAGK